MELDEETDFEILDQKLIEYEKAERRRKSRIRR